MSLAREDLSRRKLLTTGAISAASVAVSPVLLPGIYVTGAEGRPDENAFVRVLLPTVLGTGWSGGDSSPAASSNRAAGK